MVEPEFENPWAKGGKFYPKWIDDNDAYIKNMGEYVIGKRKYMPIRVKNPMTEELITEEELQVFESILGRIPQGNPYEWLIKIFNKLTGLKFPELPADTRLQGDWNLMFSTWFFETMPPFDSAYWVNNSKTIFTEPSIYCSDIANSISFSDINNRACIKNQFFKYSDNKRPNPLNVSFSFTGPDSGRQNYYSWVEWFLGSYSTIITWKKKQDDGYEILARVNNTSSWYSGTRLPKSWQIKIRESIGFEIKNLVDSAARSETIKRKLNPLVIKTLEFMGVNIPSLGGNWEQEYYVKTLWIV